MKVTLMPGIESISGSIKSARGKRTVFITRTNAKGKRETRMYFRSAADYQRKAPVTEKEMAARKRFAEATAYFKNLAGWQRFDYEHQWRADKHCYNGKKYATLRGYVIARFYANDLAN